MTPCPACPSDRHHPPPVTLVVLVVAVGTLVTLALGTSEAGASPARWDSTSIDTATQGGTRPGDLVIAIKVDRPTISPPTTLWRITYRSRGRTGIPDVVSGFAMVPEAPVPAGGRAVLAWAHGTTGLADRCAPSRNLRLSLAPYGYEQLLAGGVVVQTDYEGLGTPGEHTYLDGVSEGHAVLDSVRAIEQLPGVGHTGGVVVAGQSEGGGAALWAAQLAPTYAPQLDLRGVVALAPAAELPTIAAGLPDSPFRGLILLAASGLHASYGSAFDPSTFLTGSALRDLPRARHECVDATVARYRTSGARAVVTRDPDSMPGIRRILVANSPGHVGLRVPVLLAQGAQDQQIPLAVSARLHTRYCGFGTTIIRMVAAGADHDGVVDAVHGQAIQWMADRFAGRPAPTDCPTTTPSTSSGGGPRSGGGPS